ncbi:MAG: hypothetical protein ABSD20_15405 [Terriglobales bacterium]|jgi:hypothetical protein
MADSRNDLKRDGSGNIMTRPVMGWEIGPLAETALLLIVRHAGSAEEFEAGGETTQLLLTPQQALLLAEALTKWGSTLHRAPIDPNAN